MQAIGNEILQNRPDARVMYVNSERYVGEMVNALQHGRINKFKQFYRGLDALLLDDVQFFAGKDQTQEEFFHNFNALLEGGQQIVLTCDRYPKEVNGLEERLKTRFGWGLSVSVEPPELEMRVAHPQQQGRAERRAPALRGELLHRQAGALERARARGRAEAGHGERRPVRAADHARLRARDAQRSLGGAGPSSSPSRTFRKR